MVKPGICKEHTTFARNKNAGYKKYKLHYNIISGYKKYASYHIM